MMSPRCGFRKWKMNRFASTRSEKRDMQPLPGRAQWSVGSIDEDGIRYGLTIHALIPSTIATAPTIVSTQSAAIRHGRGRRRVSRSTGFREWCSGSGGGGGGGPRGGGGGGARGGPPPVGPGAPRGP